MRKFVITLVVLAVLLVAADFGLRAYAESRAADAINSELGRDVQPDVSIEGFPFLLHAIQGSYPEVIMTASTAAGSITGVHAVLDLSRVTLPLATRSPETRPTWRRGPRPCRHCSLSTHSRRRSVGRTSS